MLYRFLKKKRFPIIQQIAISISSCWLPYNLHKTISAVPFVIQNNYKCIEVEEIKKIMPAHNDITDFSINAATALEKCYYRITIGKI